MKFYFFGDFSQIRKMDLLRFVIQLFDCNIIILVLILLILFPEVSIHIDNKFFRYFNITNRQTGQEILQDAGGAPYGAQQPEIHAEQNGESEIAPIVQEIWSRKETQVIYSMNVCVRMDNE